MPETKPTTADVTAALAVLTAVLTSEDGAFQASTDTREQLLAGAEALSWLNRQADFMAWLAADNTDSVKLPAGDPQAWAREQFEFENCAECGGDETNHDIIPVLGNWFARCRTDDVTPEPDPAPTLTWTYSQVNAGGADVSHGHTFTGTDAEWAEHLAELTQQGIEVYNAITRITFPTTDQT